MCVEEGRREVPRGHWSPCWAQIVNEFLWRTQICPRIFSCVLLDMCSIHMYCVGKCTTHVRELLEVRLSVTPISESISEQDKGGTAGTYELTRVSVSFRATSSHPVKAVTVAPTVLPLLMLTISDQVHHVDHL